MNKFLEAHFRPGHDLEDQCRTRFKNFSKPVKNERKKGTTNSLSWVAQNTLAIEDIQRRFDERVRIAIGRLDLVGQVVDLQERVEALEKETVRKTPLFGLMTSVSLEVDPGSRSMTAELTTGR